MSPAPSTLAPIGPLCFHPSLFLSLNVTLLVDFFAPYFPRLSPLMNFGHFAATDGAAGSRWRQSPGSAKGEKKKGGGGVLQW